jgi:transcriptional regulator with XRE-family HTH domain
VEAPLLLNPSALRSRIAARGLRQWWLAEQLGVDRRTVLRWVNGQVRQIAPERAAALAGVLGCPVAELLRHDPAQPLAGVEDQRRAGAAIAASRLLDRLGPVGDWDVAEQLIRAAAVPDLPLHVLGRLYHQLSVACWRQDKLAEAAVHNASALALAERCGDVALRADALGSRANLAYWRGEVDAAFASWREALALAPWLEPRPLGALHSNLGAALGECGDAAAGTRHLREALRCFDADGTPMNRAIAHGQLALLALARDDDGAAAAHNASARAESQRADYRRGLALAALIDGVLAAGAGATDEAEAAVRRGLAAFAALGIADSLNHRLAAMAWRRLGRADAARAAADEALRLAAAFPLERQAAEAELARVRALSPPV